jgi:uncharacterized SAM-binding protein YcdF (DUF218 family)
MVLGIAVYLLRGLMRQPQAILVLGGATAREEFAAQFAQEHPDLPIWVSSGSNPEFTEWVFAEAGVDLARLHLDYQAVDTVTNFTTLVEDFETQGINSIYLITSDYHMRRAKVIGTIVLGSQGIDFKPVVVSSEQAPESLDKVIRDGVRAIVWVATGHTGSTLRDRFLPESRSSQF